MPIYYNTRFCSLCGASDHSIKACPRNYCPDCKILGHLRSRCPERTCYSCGQKGHLAERCTTFQECEKCYSLKHGINRCPHRFSEEVFIRPPTNMNKRISLEIAAASIAERTRSDFSATAMSQPQNKRPRWNTNQTSTMTDQSTPIPQGEDIPVRDM